MSGRCVSGVTMYPVGVYLMSTFVRWLCIRGQHVSGWFVADVSMCPVGVYPRSAGVW